MTMIDVTTDSLESVIETGLAVLGHNINLPKSNIHALAEFIMNYYSPDESAALSVQFIGEPDVR
jgi:hypothetical protein